MINKTKFIEIIDRLTETNDFVEETNERARKLKDAIRSEFTNAMSLSISHEELVVQLLENMFNDYSGIISWWMYDLDYGRKYIYGCAQDKNGKNIDLSTSSKLYDFLISNMNDKNEIKKTT